MSEAPEIVELSERLAAVFNKIRTERMHGVPIINPRLEVEVIGVQDWNGHWLALVVTPWFINLMLLAQTTDQADAWRNLAIGAEIAHRFPAGRFDFLIGEEEGIGRYQMCSLFSPVLEFQDQVAARIAGRAALEALFDADIDAPTEEAKTQAAATVERPATSMSRRGLLTGKLTGKQDPAA